MASWPDPPEAGPLQQVQLELLPVAVRVALSQRLGKSIADSAEVRWIAEEAAYSIEAVVLAEALPPQFEEAVQLVTVEYPDGWWEAFRHEYRDRWWMRRSVARRPVRMHVERRMASLRVDLRRYQTFPRASVALPDGRLGEPVWITQTERAMSVRSVKD